MAFRMTMTDTPAEIRLTPGYPEDMDMIERAFNLRNEGDFVCLVRKNGPDGTFFLTTDRSLVLPGVMLVDGSDPVVEDTHVYDEVEPDYEPDEE